jgi:hypothetical protein
MLLRRLTAGWFVSSTGDEMSELAAGPTKRGTDLQHHFEFAYETPTKEVYECTGGCGDATCHASRTFPK